MTRTVAGRAAELIFGHVLAIFAAEGDGRAGDGPGVGHQCFFPS